jgi:threonine dehydrogenase-like Zn-dependent dehydrogenase
MRAIVLNDGLRLQYDYPIPNLSHLPHSEVLIRVRQVGICNTDLELRKGYAGFRGVPGHEFVGVVEKCPADPGWVGQRVVGEINVACGDCATCRAGRPTHCPSRTTLGIRGRDGALADYLTLPLENLHVVPEKVSDDQAVFVEPLAAALEITDQIHLRPTERVVVLGDGKLGQLTAQVLALTGCDLTVVGRHQEKLDLLAVRGIDTCLVGRADQEPKILADVVVEATGTPTGFATAQRMVRPRGKMVLKSTYHGLAQTDLSKIVVDEVQVIGSRCGPFAPALRLLAQGLMDVEPLIQARYPLGEGILALEKAAVKGALKILVEMEA